MQRQSGLPVRQLLSGAAISLARSRRLLPDSSTRRRSPAPTTAFIFRRPWTRTLASAKALSPSTTIGVGASACVQSRRRIG